jgi:flagellar biosynthetic protein FlhB
MPEHAGEKTEQATPRRLEEALKKGQFARSPEVQTVFVLCAGLIALRMAGLGAWEKLALAFTGIFNDLGRITISHENMQSYLINGSLLFAICVGPVVICTLIAGLLAGGIQSRFNTASEALEVERYRNGILLEHRREHAAHRGEDRLERGAQVLVPIGLERARALGR